VVLDSNHIFLSAIQAETLSQRFAALKDGKKGKPPEETDDDQL